ALSDRTTGTLLYGPDDHARVLAAWDELYDWTAALATRWQAAARLPASPVTQALQAARLPARPSLAARSAAALASPASRGVPAPPPASAGTWPPSPSRKPSPRWPVPRCARPPARRTG